MQAINILRTLLLTPSALALISIAPGKYDIATLVANHEGQIDAFFNMHTRSECHLILDGPQAKILASKIQRISGYQLQIEVKEKILCGIGTVVLLSFKEPKASIKKYVGNNLVPNR